jgi:hypothetical protein
MTVLNATTGAPNTQAGPGGTFTLTIPGEQYPNGQNGGAVVETSPSELLWYLQTNQGVEIAQIDTSFSQ